MATHPEDGKEKREGTARQTPPQPDVPLGRTFGRGLAGEASAGASATLWWVFGISCVLIVLGVLGWFYYEELTATRLERNEEAAIATLRELRQAAYDYAEKYRRAPASLAALGPAAEGEPNEDAAGLLDAELVRGELSGYRFRYEPVDSDGDGTPDGFRIFADPAEPGRSGSRWFFVDATGLIRESREGPATPSSPPIPGGGG